MPNDIRKLNTKLMNIAEFLNTEGLHILGNEAVNFAQEQHQHEGFENVGVEKWPEVKRRRIGSSWFGFQAGETASRPGQRKKRSDSVTNFSPAATSRPILTGETGNLADSYFYTITGRKVVISNRMPYAGVQNDGGDIKVFGKHRAKLKPRKAIGKSQALNRRMVNAVKPRLNQILNA